MKLFQCIIDDGFSLHKVFVAKKSKKSLLEEIENEGVIVEKIKEVTNDYFTNDTPERLNSSLLQMGWGEGERELICALVKNHIEGLKR